MKIITTIALSLLVTTSAFAQTFKNADAYDQRYAPSVINRSVFYAPVHGGLYKDKWEEVVKRDPNVRAIAIHLHGCGGMGYLEKIVADYYIGQLGIAVITPDFLARPGNKAGCPGRGHDDAFEGGKMRHREGVYTSVNPFRMDARTDDVAVLVDYIKSLTNKPIILSGHSEGARTVYHWDKVDSQIVGAVIHNQSCTADFAHLFRLPTSYKTFQVLEDNDPWAYGNTDCSRFFRGADAKNITLLKQRGNNHRPLQNDEVKRELKAWLDNILGGSWRYTPTHNEELLPEVQQKIKQKVN